MQRGAGCLEVVTHEAPVRVCLQRKAVKPATFDTLDVRDLPACTLRQVSVPGR